MERSLVWSVLAIGGAGWLCGFLLTRAPRSGGTRPETGDGGPPRPFLLVALCLPFLVFLATWPSSPPLFAPGHGFGDGFLLGGLLALLGAWTLMRAFGTAPSDTSPTRASAAAVSPYFLSLVAVAVPLLWMRASLADMLLGVAIGGFCVTTTVILGLLVRDPAPAPRVGPEPETASSPHPVTQSSSHLVTLSPCHPVILPLLSGVGFLILLCAASMLGEYRGTISLTAARFVSWSALALVFAAGVPLLLLLSAVPASLFASVATRLPLATPFARMAEHLFPSEEARQAGARGWRLILCALLLLLLGKLVSGRVVGEPHLFHVMVLGLLTGLLAWWVTAGRTRQERQTAAEGMAVGWQNGALAILVVLAGAMAAYQMLAGFGVGLLLIAAWLSAGLAVASALESFGESRSGVADGLDTVRDVALQTAFRSTLALLFGVVVLLYRVFSTRFADDLQGAALTDHYALFGVLVGAMLPALLAGFLLRPTGATPMTSGSRILRLCVAGLLTLVVPAVIIALWGEKCALALFIGLALALATTDVAPGLGGELIALFALATALAMTQWTHHIMPLSVLTKAQKIHFILWAVGIVMLLVLLADYAGRVGTWLRSRKPQQVGARAASEGGSK